MQSLDFPTFEMIVESNMNNYGGGNRVFELVIEKVQGCRLPVG